MNRPPPKLVSFASAITASVLIFAVASAVWAQGGSSGQERASVAVAAFRGDDLGSGNLPDISELLAAALRNAPVRVVPPALFGEAPEGGEGAPDAMAAWAQGAAADVFVTGQVLRFGEKLSIHTRLRSAADGSIVETFVEEVPRGEERLEGIAALSQRILGGIERTLDISFAEDAESESDNTESATGEGSGQSTLRVGGDEPIEIQSEEIEVVPQKEGGRRIVFTTGVIAEQGPIRLEANRLEAIYPPESESPARYVATGAVQIREDRGEGRENRQMFCDRAVLLPGEDRLLCNGNAELREGADRVRGQEIEILFERDVVKVRGGAYLNLGAAE